MKNITPWVQTALRLRARMQRQTDAEEALSPYHPIGFCGAVQRPGEAPVYRWVGNARMDGAPVTRDTIFRVASVSKIFVAAAAVRLVRQRKLSLDGDISEALGFDVGRAITLRQLLTHTAALDDTRAYDRAIAMDILPPLDSVLPNSFLPYQPGTRFRYSNLGAGVAGMLVEAASGMLFDDYVCASFFKPHGIDASFHPQRILHKERMANCYRVPGETLAYDAQAIAKQPLDETPDPLRHYNVPAGKLMISAPDLLDALGRLYREDSELFVRQAQIGSVSCDSGRGLGLSIAPEGLFRRDRWFWGHQGVAYGALCEAWLDAEDATAVVMLTNGMRLPSIGPLYLGGQDGIRTMLDLAGGALVY
ncbi:beta-lactamase family protein [Eubacteriales bacterium OttesenSCG-928-A19]|nr:beta-lactamase family protein [Eubacteriales bacterium OttesenSCG-928-A19]